MAIFLDALNVSPSPLPQGQTAVTLTYQGFVSATTENPVQLTFSVDPTNNDVFIVDNGNNVKSISWTQAFPTAQQGLTKNGIVINVMVGGGGITLCDSSLDAVTSTGSAASSDYFIIY